MNYEDDYGVLELDEYSWKDKNGNEYVSEEEYYEMLEEADIN